MSANLLISPLTLLLLLFCTPELVSKQISITSDTLSPNSENRLLTNNGVHVLPSRKRVRPSGLLKYSFLAPSGLKALVHLEWNMYGNIKHLYGAHRNRTRGTFRLEFKENHRGVQTYLQDFEQSARKFVGRLDQLPVYDMKMVEKVASNLLAVFRAIARFRDYFTVWITDSYSAKSKLMRRINSYLKSVYNNSHGPTKDDLEIAVLGIVRIQFFYDLLVKDMADGIVLGTNLNVTLNAKDCFLIGINAISRKFYTSGIEWLDHALYLVQNTSDESMKYEDVFDELVTAEMLHDELYAKANADDYYFFTEPIRQVRESSLRFKRKSMLHYYPLKTKTNDSTHADVKFWEGCKGTIYQSENERSKLFCWYEREVHPYYKIGPIKTELHSIHPKPEVVQFYDVISDCAMKSLQIDRYLNYYKPKLRERNHFIQPASYYLHPYVNELGSRAAENALQLLERVTGLKSLNTTTEGLPIFAHSPGGARLRHFDYTPDTGIYLATFILYLSDVEKGGETAFLHADFKVPVVKGSATFWYNQFSCGEGDATTEHASCPVIVGEKWAAVKGIMHFEQHHLKCHLKPHTRHEILVNGKSKYT